MRDDEIIVWDKKREPHLDYMRIEFYEFENPEDSHGKPDLDDNNLEIYGWTNIPYDPHSSTQTRKVFGLKPNDLGGSNFSLDSCDALEYPQMKTVDAHKVGTGDEDIESPTPNLEASMGHQLKEIPDRVHPTKDKVRFDSAKMNGFSIELDPDDNLNPTRLNLDREFSTYTLIQMDRNVDGFELPETITAHLVSDQL